MNVKAGVRRALASDVVYPWLRRYASARRPTYFLTYHTLGSDDERFNAWTVLRISDFLRQVQELRKGFDVVSIDDALAGHESVDTKGARPRAVITFDDGHSGWYEHLLPVVQREALPVTLYTATSHIETGSPYWFDRVMNAVQPRQSTTIDLRAWGLAQWTVGSDVGASNWHEVSTLLEALKGCGVAVRDACVEAIEDQTATVRRDDFAPLRPLTVNELQTIARSPHVTVGAHSQDHQLLDTLPLDEAVTSIRQSRETLRRWTGQCVNHFAFPNGNHTPALVDAVMQLGFRSAATTVQRSLRRGDSVFQIPRMSIGRFDTMDRFRLKLVGG